MPSYVRTYGRTSRGPFTVRLFRLSFRRRPLSARNRRLRARANRLRDRELFRVDRRVISIFDSVVDNAERELSDRVPVRTGLMRRRVDARGLAIGGIRSIDLRSDARNKKGREYAKYVDRYNRALSHTLVSAESAISSAFVRFSEYRISFVFGFVRSSVRIAKASRFMSVHKSGTRLIFELQSPQSQPLSRGTATVSLL